MKSRQGWTPEQIADDDRQRNLRWRLANAEKIRQRKRELYLQNHAYELERARKKRNPENEKVYGHNRRAKKLSAGGTYTIKDIQFLAHTQKSLCIYCRATIAKKKLACRSHCSAGARRIKRQNKFATALRNMQPAQA